MVVVGNAVEELDAIEAVEAMEAVEMNVVETGAAGSVAVDFRVGWWRLWMGYGRHAGWGRRQRTARPAGGGR